MQALFLLRTHGTKTSLTAIFRTEYPSIGGAAPGWKFLLSICSEHVVACTHRFLSVNEDSYCHCSVLRLIPAAMSILALISQVFNERNLDTFTWKAGIESDPRLLRVS